MNIGDFKYNWRFTDNNYALFSEKELSEITSVPTMESSMLWDSVCENPILEECSFVREIVSHTLPIIIRDCGWGDDNKENITRKILESLFAEEKTDSITVLYDRETAIIVSRDLFVNRWSDFCYPSDALLIKSDHRCLLYYEDIIYLLV